MSDPADINDRLEAAAVKAEGGSEIMRRFANDPAGSFIPTETGPLASIKEWVAQKNNELVPVGRFVGISATPPTTRLDNTPLQIADEWHNPADRLRYSWNSTAWVALNSSAQQLEERLADPEQGANIVSWGLSKLTRSIATASDALDHFEVPLWKFAKYATGYVAGGDPATWDWAPAIAKADEVIDAVSMNGGCIVAMPGTYGIGSQATIKGLGKTLRSHGGRSVSFNALPGYLGDVIVFTGSSYCQAQNINIRGSGGPNQRCLYFPYRVDSGVTLQNRIDNVQTENCAVGVLLENPVHCTVSNVRTTRDCTLYGLHSQFVAGVGAGQGGTNLRLIGGWFQSHETTGTSVRINSNLSFSSLSTQFEHGRYGLVLRACSGASVVTPLFEDCGLPIQLQGCTNPTIISPNVDSGTTPDLNIAIQPLIELDGGKGIKILGVNSIGDNKAYIDCLIRFTNNSYGVYSDNVLIDEYYSEGNKGFIGAENVPRLRVVKDGIMTMQGMVLRDVRVQLPIRTSPPPSPMPGESFNADGVLWQPVPGGRARVIYQGAGVYLLEKSW